MSESRNRKRLEIWRNDDGVELLTTQERCDPPGKLATYSPDKHFKGLFTEDDLGRAGYKKIEKASSAAQ